MTRLPLDDLTGLVAQTQPGQCHLFSASDQLLATDEIRDLCTSGLLVAHRRALGQILTEGREAGLLKVGLAEHGGDLQRLVSFDGRTHAVPRDLWVIFFVVSACTRRVLAVATDTTISGRQLRCLPSLPGSA